MATLPPITEKITPDIEEKIISTNTNPPVSTFIKSNNMASMNSFLTNTGPEDFGYASRWNSDLGKWQNNGPNYYVFNTNTVINPVLSSEYIISPTAISGNIYGTITESGTTGQFILPNFGTYKVEIEFYYIPSAAASFNVKLNDNLNNPYYSIQVLQPGATQHIASLKTLISSYPYTTTNPYYIYFSLDAPAAVTLTIQNISINIYMVC
jgi:hypothetical protein